MHAVLRAAKALLRRFGLSALLIACTGQLYPRESNFPTSVFDAQWCHFCDMGTLGGIFQQDRKGGASQAAEKGVAAALCRQVGIAIIEVMAT
jgi:hypothetical protein